LGVLAPLRGSRQALEKRDLAVEQSRARRVCFAQRAHSCPPARVRCCPASALPARGFFYPTFLPTIWTTRNDAARVGRSAPKAGGKSQSSKPACCREVTGTKLARIRRKAANRRAISPNFHPEQRAVPGRQQECAEVRRSIFVSWAEQANDRLESRVVVQALRKAPRVEPAHERQFRWPDRGRIPAAIPPEPQPLTDVWRCDSSGCPPHRRRWPIMKGPDASASLQAG
jgi:hypothetical protein